LNAKSVENLVPKMLQSQNVEWLLDKIDDSPSTSASAPETNKIQIAYPPDIATGFSERTRTREGIVLIQDTHHFTQRPGPSKSPLGNFSFTFQEPVFVINVVHEGQVLLTDLESNESRLRQSGTDGFGHLLSCSLEQLATSSQSLITTTLIIPMQYLRQLLDEETITMMLERLLVDKLNTFSCYPVPASISKMLENCLDHTLRDLLKSLQLQARVLDYLCSLALHLDSGIVKSQNQHPAKVRAQNVRNWLMHVGAETPTLASISDQFGASPNKLNAEFTLEYGESIFSFLRNYRLEQAHLAIEKGGQPLKVIAHRIGYSHVNHFITAFKQKFNRTPGSLRS
jgi:AraC-like DNA-binding protein